MFGRRTSSWGHHVTCNGEEPGVAETGSYPAQRVAHPEPQLGQLHATPVPLAVSDFLQRHHREWRAATCHAFLDGVRDGGLPVGAFLAWLQQDYLFVNDLLAFQARLLAGAPRPAQSVLAAGLVALEAELTWFEAQLARRELPLVAARHPTTDAYRKELERLSTEPVEVGITALWALERAYLEAWRGAAPGAAEYREFIEHWTAPAFARYVAGLEVHATDSPGTEAAWLRIVRLEREFWNMALGAG
ncbi:MAG TPA: TenA family transcriptional regulator [Candidatus Dormibacteraeota bacterium]|nr:TenA family transcriptional regulator [Candidatus Dormibacteraeota bacterium]